MDWQQEFNRHLNRLNNDYTELHEEDKITLFDKNGLPVAVYQPSTSKACYSRVADDKDLIVNWLKMVDI